MDKKDIRQATAKRYRQLSKFSHAMIVGLDGECIHQFRVEYKQLRGFFRMLSTRTKIKVSHTLKAVYQTAGSIRDLQLQSARIAGATKAVRRKPQGYLRLLDREIKTLRPGLQEGVEGNPVMESKKKTDAVMPEKFTRTALRQYIAQIWTAVFTLILSGHFSDDQLHHIRKLLKDLYNNLKIIEKLEPGKISLQRWKGQDRRYYEKLIDDLGDFQDHCTALRLLRPYWLSKLDKNNRDLLQQVKNEWIRKKTLLKKMILKRLKEAVIPGTN